MQIADCRLNHRQATTMNWFKITVNDASEEGYACARCSAGSLEQLAKNAITGFIRLDSLLYRDRRKVVEWEKWDVSLMPTAFINPRTIVSIMPYKGDPRTIVGYIVLFAFLHSVRVLTGLLQVTPLALWDRGLEMSNLQKSST
jgi:hypothetical protein